MNEDLKVIVVENGFIAYDFTGAQIGTKAKSFVFKDAVSLSVFIKDWGERNTKLPSKLPQVN
mgnify:CR=1 FL=1|jgi:hypothetical protein|tara:strand:+ start:4240 stop:4425 length:186 start_codon:yes stop_codon:yes gene_type:complete